MTAPSLRAMAARLAALEARLGDIEGGYGQTMYRQERRTVRLELNMERIMNHLGVPAATEEDVDTALDERT